MNPSYQIAGTGDETLPLLYGLGFMGRVDQSGISGLSFAGGASILISGAQLAAYPTDNVIKMVSSAPSFVLQAPSLNCKIFI